MNPTETYEAPPLVTGVVSSSTKEIHTKPLTSLTMVRLPEQGGLTHLFVDPTRPASRTTLFRSHFHNQNATSVFSVDRVTTVRNRRRTLPRQPTVGGVLSWSVPRPIEPRQDPCGITGGPRHPEAEADQSKCMQRGPWRGEQSGTARAITGLTGPEPCPPPQAGARSGSDSDAARGVSGRAVQRTAGNDNEFRSACADKF